METGKYPNGYTEKIKYYKKMVNKSIANLDQVALEYYTTRLSYFISRQVAVNKSVTDPS